VLVTGETGEDSFNWAAVVVCVWVTKRTSTIGHRSASTASATATGRGWSSSTSRRVKLTPSIRWGRTSPACLVDVAHDKGVPVFWTRVVYSHPDAADAGLWTKKAPLIAEWKEGTEWVEIDDRCHVGADDHILDKRHASSFHETELDSMLTSMGCDTVIVAGCSTSACVRSTVDDASAHGYHTIVPETCVGDRSEQQHEAHLWDLDKKFADVEPTDAVAEYLQSL